MWTKRGMAAMSMAALLGSVAWSAEPPVALRLADHAEVLTTIAAGRGKVVVLDCWSTSCPPCVRDFPRLVALAEKYPDDVVCVSLSFDYEGIGAAADVMPKVRTFLEAVGARRVTNLLGREESDALSRKLDVVGVPVVFVYGRDGRLLERYDDDARRRLGRPFTYDDIEREVAAAVGGRVAQE